MPIHVFGKTLPMHGIEVENIVMEDQESDLSGMCVSRSALSETIRPPGGGGVEFVQDCQTLRTAGLMSLQHVLQTMRLRGGLSSSDGKLDDLDADAGGFKRPRKLSKHGVEEGEFKLIQKSTGDMSTGGLRLVPKGDIIAVDRMKVINASHAEVPVKFKFGDDPEPPEPTRFKKKWLVSE